MNNQKLVWLLGMFLLVLGRIASAQVTTGTISGVVKDSSGAVIPGVTVVLRNDDTGATRTVPTDAAGRYSASTLSLGTYRVTATTQGFQTEVRTGIVLSVAREAVVDVTMAVGTVTQTAEVAGEASTVETQSATVSGLVDGTTMRDLPLNGRSYVDLATLTPGVYMQQNSHSDPTSGYGERLTVNGSRYDQNVYLVDGTYANTHNGNTSGVGGESLGVEAFREFRVLTHNFSAEYGHSIGGVISVVTRSGTNQLHGTLYEFVRNNVFDARSFFNVGPLPPFRRNQFGGAAGGAIKKDRIFYFGNYESLHERLGQTLITAVPDANARMGLIPNATTGVLQQVTLSPKIVPYLALWPLPNGPSFNDGTAQLASNYSQPTTENYYMGRVDFRLSDKDNLYGRYIDDRSNLNQSRPIPIFAVGDVGNSHLSVLGETHVFSPTKLNEFLFSFNRTTPAGVPVQLTSQDLSSLFFVPGTWFGNIRFTQQAAGSLEIGNNPSVPYAFTTNIFTTGDNFSWVRGAHSLKFGVSFERYQYNPQQGADTAGVWQFSSITGLLAAQASKQLIGFVNSNSSRERSFRNDYFAWYIQDDYRVNSRLTLNLGLRQEFLTPPNEQFGRSANLINLLDAQSTIGPSYEPAKLNFGPRVGAAWDPTGSGKTAIRVGAGVYFDQYETGTNDYRFYTVATLLSANTTFPVEPASAPAGSVSEGTVQFHLPTPTAIHYGLNVQRQLTRTVAVMVGYVGSHSYNLTSTNNVDTRTPQTCPCAAAPALPAGYFPYFPLTAPNINPNFSTVSQTRANTIANYNALQAMIRKSVGAGLTFQASYSYSKAFSEYDGSDIGVTNTGANGVLDVNNVGRDYALSSYDQRHTFLFNSLYQMPWERYLKSRASKAFLGGWAANAIWTYGSGVPINLNMSNNVSQTNDPNAPDRPNLAPGATTNNPTSGVTAGCGVAIPGGQPLHTPNRWFDPCVFVSPTAGTFGNLGRDTVQGPDYNQVNFSMVKRTSITELMKLEFRAEAFNLFNHASFGVPNQKLFDSTGAHTGQEGVIISTTAPGREIQFGLKLTF